MDMRKVTRRDLLKAAGLAGVGVLVAACAPQATPTTAPEPTQAQAEQEPTAVPEVTQPSPAPEGAKLAFWYYWGGVWGEACAAVGQAFADANPGITVEPTALDGAWEKAVAAFAAGAPPDVILDYNAAQLMPRGQAVALDDLIAGSSVIKKDNYYPAMYECYQWNGVQYGVPAGEAGVDMALILNKGRCEEAGLDVNDPPQTVTEVLAWGEKMTKVGEGGVLEQVGFDPMDGTSCAWCDWAALYGFNWWDAKTQTFDWAPLADCLQWQADWINKWGAKNFEAFRSGFGGWLEPDSSMALGKQAMHINGYWTPGELALKGAEGEEWSYTWAPRPDNRKDVHAQLSQPYGIFISAPAKQLEAAFKLLEFVCTDEANQMFFDKAGGFAWTKSWLAKVDVNKYPGLDFYVKSIAEADELYCNVQNCPIGFNFAWDQYWKALNAVIYDGKKPEDVLAEAQTACEEELARLIKG